MSLSPLKVKKTMVKYILFMLSKTSYFNWLVLNSHFFWQAVEQIQYMTKLAAKNIDGQMFCLSKL